MKAEPTDIRLPRVATQRRTESSRKARTNVNVLDEAFATASDADFRLDESHRESAQAVEAGSLSSVLRQQLKALETQQRELSTLLSGLND